VTDAMNPMVSATAGPFTLSSMNITVSEPEPGSVLVPGGTHSVAWSARGVEDSFRIEVSFDSGATWGLIASVAEGKEYTWRVPDAAPEGSAQIRVTSYSHPDVFGLSGVFEVALATPTSQDEVASGGQLFLTSPYEGMLFSSEPWVRSGEPVTAYGSDIPLCYRMIEIKWASYEVDGDVAIEFSADAGENWLSVVRATANDGEYRSYHPPYASTDEAVIRISSVDYPNLYSTSPMFSIIAEDSNLAIIRPKTGAVLHSGTVYEIDFGTTSVAWFPLRIELSADGGQTWDLHSDVASLPFSIGILSSWLWTVPRVDSDLCVLRFTATENPELVTTSDIFTVTSAPYIEFVDPRTSQVWQGGTEVEIGWVAHDVDGLVMLSFTQDDGQSWDTIAAEWPVSQDNGYGSYTWIVPDIASGNCRIKLMSLSAGYVSAVTGRFVIVPDPS